MSGDVTSILLILPWDAVQVDAGIIMGGKREDVQSNSAGELNVQWTGWVLGRVAGIPDIHRQVKRPRKDPSHLSHTNYIWPGGRIKLHAGI